MRKILIFVLAIGLGNAYGQGKTLFNVLVVTPKMGKASSFDRTWKAHHAKYHVKDDGRQVYEILSGDNAGNLIIVTGPTSLADMDKERATDVAHNADYDNTIVPFVEKHSGAYTYRHIDTLSYNGNVKADKYITTMYNVKQGKSGDFSSEMRRGRKITEMIQSPSSYNVYIKQWAGSQPQFIVVTGLKDGFKQLDNAYFPSSTAFKDSYIKEYGQEQWDKRTRILSEITENFETYISKYRKDLSTAAK